MTDSDHHHGNAVISRMQALLDENLSREIRVNLHEAALPEMRMPGNMGENMGGDMADMHRQMMQARLTPVELTLSVALSGGQWLNVATRCRASRTV